MIDRWGVGAGVFFVLAGLIFLLDGLEVIAVGTSCCGRSCSSRWARA